jgi:hypothetical protein
MLRERRAVAREQLMRLGETRAPYSLDLVPAGRIEALDREHRFTGETGGHGRVHDSEMLERDSGVASGHAGHDSSLGPAWFFLRRLVPFMLLIRGPGLPWTNSLPSAS